MITLDDIERITENAIESQDSDSSRHYHGVLTSTAIPAMMNALRDVLAVHKPGRTFHGHGFSELLCTCRASYPCPTLEAIYRHINPDTQRTIKQSSLL